MEERIKARVEILNLTLIYELIKIYCFLKINADLMVGLAISINLVRVLILMLFWCNQSQSYSTLFAIYLPDK